MRTPWAIGFKDRGHGHGDYAILDAEGNIVAEFRQCQDVYLASLAPEMLDALKDALPHLPKELYAKAWSLIVKSGEYGREAADKERYGAG